MALKLSSPVTDRSILRVLAVGFAMVIALLAVASVIAIIDVKSIKESAQALAREQLVNTRLIDEIQSEQGTLSAVFHKLAGDPEAVDKNQIVMQLDEADQAIRKTVAAATGSPEDALWADLRSAVEAFSSEARHFLNMQSPPDAISRELIERQQRVVAIVGRLIAASYGRGVAAQNQIEERYRGLAWQSTVLLAACILLALACAILTVRTTTRLFRNMEWQTGELSRVSWQMLERQEDTARRFSHELHDELGQTLTALKANLVALNAPPQEFRQVRDDCLQLVEEAIANVRELSQLLHPTILDDFGLDASLRWLAENFSRRTGIRVDYESNATGRLTDEAETHLFRIAQEALTNIARHSGATRVSMELIAAGEDLRLIIVDDGKGFQADTQPATAGLGMLGMRARARSAGGEVIISSPVGAGLTIAVTIPMTSALHEAEHQSLAR
jgi:signal transduction histidine kinase